MNTSTVPAAFVSSLARIHVQTTNQPSSYFTFTIPATAEALSDVLGWHPEREGVARVLGTLRRGCVADVSTRQVPGDVGTSCVAYMLRPVFGVAVVAPTAMTPDTQPEITPADAHEIGEGSGNVMAHRAIANAVARDALLQEDVRIGRIVFFPGDLCAA